MTLDDVKELCADFGYVDNGGWDNLRLWLRERLGEPDELRERVADLELYAECAVDGDEHTAEVQELRDELEALKAKVRSAIGDSDPAARRSKQFKDLGALVGQAQEQARAR